MHHLIELKNSSQDICEDVNNRISKSYKESSDLLSSTSSNSIHLHKINTSGKETIEPRYLLKAISSVII